jgi:cell division protein FtsA
MIVDVEECAATIRTAFDVAQRMAGDNVDSVYVSLSPLHASLTPARGLVAIMGEGQVVSEDDLRRVTEAAKVMNLPPNREILDVISREYIVDGYGGLRDPLGMIGMRLELEALLVIGNLTAVANLQRAVEQAGLKVIGFISKPLALGEYLLTDDEREQGTALVDMGSSSIEIGYFKEGSLRQMGVIPLGGRAVSNDLAVVLKSSLAVAERLKTELDLFTEGEHRDELIDLAKYGHSESRQVPLRHVSEIAAARLEELFRLIVAESMTLTSNEEIPSAMVFTGGVIQSRGMGALLRRYMPGAVRLSQNTKGIVDDQGFNTAVAILVYAHAAGRVNVQEDAPKGKLSRLAGWLREFWE